MFATVKHIAKENNGVLADKLSQHLRLNITVQLLDKTADDLRLAIMAAAN